MLMSLLHTYVCVINHIHTDQAYSNDQMMETKLKPYTEKQYGTAQRQRRTRCSSRACTRLEPSSLQLENRSTLGLQQ